MRYVVLIFFPWLSLILQGKYLGGFKCLLLQLTIIGWIPASIWANASLSKSYAIGRSQRTIDAIKTQRIILDIKRGKYK